MTQDTTIVNTYLREVREAVAELPADVARDILDGISEELAGLEPDAAAERIAELGDPVFIAESARSEIPVVAAKPGDKGWYTIVTGVLFLLGGSLLFGLGWIAGLVMLWYSKTWTLRDKIVGTLIGPVIGAVVAGVVAISSSMAVAATSDVNPLVPAHLDILFGVAILAPIATAVYLFVRAHRERRTP